MKMGWKMDWNEFYFKKMVSLAKEGAFEIFLGTIIFMAYFPEMAWMLTIFLALVALYRLLEISKWGERHGYLFLLLQFLIVFEFVAVTTMWGQNELIWAIWSLPFSKAILIIGRAFSLLIIFMGSSKLLPLFDNRWNHGGN
jgi:hypothetical protein